MNRQHYQKQRKYIENNNQENKLTEYIKIIHSNIKSLKTQHQYNKSDYEQICNDTTNIIAKAHKIVYNIQIQNKTDILNFLNKSSNSCKTFLMNDNTDKNKNIFTQDSQSTNNNTTQNTMESNTLTQNVKELTLLVEKQTELYNTINDKINCSMKTLSCCMDVLSYSVEKINSIHEDLKKNNVITAKISMDNDNTNQKLLKNDDINQKLLENCHIEQNTIDNIYEDNIDINQIKNLLLDANQKSSKKNIPENKLFHYLLFNVLKNSKEMLSQIMPTMNLWQRQKIFTTVMKLVEDRIDVCSGNLSKLIENNISKTQPTNENLLSNIQKIFNTDNLKITTDDIKQANWEESSEDSDSDLENIEVKENNKDILQEIINELNKNN